MLTFVSSLLNANADVIARYPHEAMIAVAGIVAFICFRSVARLAGER